MRIVPAAVLLGAPALGRLLNVTIDDTHGDARIAGSTPHYTSEHVWWARSLGDGCTSNCVTTPDGRHAFGGTWHDETTPPGQRPSNMTFSFNGALWFRRAIRHLRQSTRLAFYLDGSADPIDQFLHVPGPEQDQYLYNQLVFKKDSLAPDQHEMLVSNWADGNSGSLIYFDYALYTINEADEPHPTGSGDDLDLA
ncbi:hypothetical protein AURDEDRAFT_175124 [Auricularia subglabra TFB-10046 SS5]|nr:hypothetical protein AURDEDRAFT_175124 [Auricularia subglabra TFB-10046 SS5]